MEIWAAIIFCDHPMLILCCNAEGNHQGHAGQSQAEQEATKPAACKADNEGMPRAPVHGHSENMLDFAGQNVCFDML